MKTRDAECDERRSRERIAASDVREDRFAHPPPRRLKRRLLDGLQRGLALAGLDRLFVTWSGGRGATILLYHSVAEGPSRRWIDPGVRIDPRLFRRQMDFLARRRTVIALSALIDAIEAGRDVAAGTVVLTFDDGYRDTLTQAAPILARRGFPATLFLPTGYVSRGQSPWVDALYASFRSRTRDRLSLPPSASPPFDLRLPGPAAAAYRAAKEILLSSRLDERDAFLADVREQLEPAGSPPRLTMSWDEVRELRRAHPAFDIGAHGRDHLDLGALPVEAARLDFSECLSDLERELGARPVFFSFPYGRWREETKALARDLGFRCALGSGPDPLVTPAIDRYAIPRLDPDPSMARFAFMTGGAYPALSRALIGRA
jgi:peptidoglycan/xylan/chitin deacetylase (PgdA/CDA1 family)